MSSGAASQDTAFRAAVVYWPADTGMFWWEYFHLDTVRRDFDAAALHGITHLDINLTWRTFQPEAGRVNPHALRCLEAVLEAAEESGRRVTIVLFPSLPRSATPLPDWTLNRFVITPEGHPIKNLFQDPEVVRGEALLVSEVTEEFSPFPAVDGWVISDRLTSLYPVEVGVVEDWLGHMLDAGTVIPGQRISWGLSARTVVTAPLSPLPPTLHPRVADDWRPRWAAHASHTTWIQFLTGYTATLGVSPVIANLGPCTTRPDRPARNCSSEQSAARNIEGSLAAIGALGGGGGTAAALYDYAPSLARLAPYRDNPSSVTRGLLREDRSAKEAALDWVSTVKKAGETPRLSFPEIDQERRMRDPEGTAREAFLGLSD